MKKRHCNDISELNVAFQVICVHIGDFRLFQIIPLGSVNVGTSEFRLCCSISQHIFRAVCNGRYFNILKQKLKLNLLLLGKQMFELFIVTEYCNGGY